MIGYQKWHFLQLFAGEGAGASGAGGAAGDGGAGAATAGAEAVDAAQTLRASGVPESMIRKYGKAYEKRARAAAPVAKATENADQQAAAATEESATTEQPQQQTPKYDWDEVMKDPDMAKRFREAMQDRGKKSKQAEDALAALMPALKSIAQEHGLDPENIDYIALGKHMSGAYEDEALKKGLSTETVARLDKQQRTVEEEKLRQHTKKIFQQAEAMKQVFPDFDINKEAENPVFVRLTSPSVGLSVEDAFYAIHRKELEKVQAQVVAQRTQQQVQNAIRSGSARPDESSGAVNASSVITRNWRNATKEELAEQAKRIRLAAARGEKLRPGQ